MGEKKTVGNFLRKTFALKKNEEEIQPETKAVQKTTTRSAKTTTAKTANPTAPKITAAKQTPASKTTNAKTTAAKTTAAKIAASKTAASKTATAKTTAAKTTAAKTAASKTAASKTATAKTTAAKTTTAKTAAAKTTAAVSKTAAAKAPVKTPAKAPVAKAATVNTNSKLDPSFSVLENAPASKTPVTFSKNMTKADNVRLYIYQNYLKPAKLSGQNKMTLVAGEVHSDMGLKSEIPTVAAAMKTRIDRLYDVEILDVRPPNASNSKLTVKYDLKNLYMEEETKTVEKRTAGIKSGMENRNESEKMISSFSADSENGYLILKELEEKLRLFVSNRVETRFGKEWWKSTDMSFLADRWNERRIMNDRTNTDKRRKTNEPLIHYASFSDYRRIINNPFAWDAFEEYFPDRGWIIQRLKELDPIRNAIMHHTPLEEDDYIRLGLYSRDILKIIDKSK